jgi:hypothetical protein
VIIEGRRYGRHYCSTQHADGLLEFKGTDVRLTLDGIQFAIDHKIEQLGYVPELDDLDDRYDGELDLLRMYGMRAQRLWDANVDFEPKDKKMMPGFEFRSLMRRRPEQGNNKDF